MLRSDIAVIGPTLRARFAGYAAFLLTALLVLSSTLSGPAMAGSDATDGATAGARVELVMVEETGCVWCETWKAQIGPIYPKTAEGRLAPLRRLEIRTAELNALKLSRPVNFTPTFVLVRDGIELGRIEGYPGEDFFWGLLGMLLERHLPEEVAALGL